MGIIEEKLKLLPDSPGSYQMRDSNGEIIYVGKAKNLKNRVRSYFHGVHNAKTTKLVSEIRDFTYIITASEREALVLEINLIKQYNPKYNIQLTDDKTYPYIAITNELHPRIIVTRNKRRKGVARYFGPYPNVYAARQTVDLLNRLYPFRKCNHIPDKTCLYYHMHQCLAPCINKDIDYKNYKNEVASFLNGNANDVINMLKEKMQDASDNLQFELAGEYRDQIKSVEYTISKQKIAINDLTSRDYIAIYEDDDEISLNIIVTRLGNIISNHQSIFTKYDAKEEIVASYLQQFYDSTTKPKEVAITGAVIDGLDEITEALVIEPQLGRKKELLDMALYNAKFNLENRRNIYKNQVLKRNETIDRLGKILGINTPEVIEAFDNSNLFGEYPVSGMVVYKHGRPSPNDFRKYHIKTVTGANDYESMKEVVYRRYYRLLMEDQKMPDLIIMDGGEIQVHAAQDVIKSLGLDIPILGIQKDDHHKATILFFREDFIKIDKNDPVFILISDISQRVHDYAISFFRSQKAKGFFSSYLDGVKGLGEKRKEALIKKFVTIDAIKNAKLCDIIDTGIPESIAIELMEHLKKQ